MKQKLIKFMIGRYGPDALSKFTIYLGLILLIISIFLPQQVKVVFTTLTLILLIYSYFRIFSKNINRRRYENAKYLRMTSGIRTDFNLKRQMWDQRKEYKFFKCPSCKSVMRVPKGKGKVRIVCRKCGNSFEKRT